jgi:hypothetical protein
MPAYKYVNLKTCKTDERGKAVHEACYAARLALEASALRSVETTARSSNFSRRPHNLEAPCFEVTSAGQTGQSGTLNCQPKSLRALPVQSSIAADREPITLH